MWCLSIYIVLWSQDAAHCMSPQLGQGANLALIDAEKLVDSLEAGITGGRTAAAAAAGGGSATATIPASLDGYTRNRWRRINFYQAQSRLLTPFFASRSKTLRLLRNALLYPGCHTPVLRTFMCARPLLLPPPAPPSRPSTANRMKRNRVHSTVADLVVALPPETARKLVAANAS
jgi:hypothetical protein